MKRTIGILGGMGPEATADLYLKIIRSTPVSRDQDHFRVIIDSNPAIPDRTAAIFGQGEDPVPALRETARNLELAGADFLVMPCNTAHYFHRQIQEAIRIPLLHMMRETVEYTVRKWPEIKRVGLLATDGTLRTGLYHQALADRGREVIVPSPSDQALVMQAIYGGEGIKAGQHEAPRRLMLGVARALLTAGAQAVVAGCTEVPLVLHEGDLPAPVIDATEILALAAVREAGSLWPAPGCK